jgi:TonB family protein
MPSCLPGSRGLSLGGHAAPAAARPGKMSQHEDEQLHGPSPDRSPADEVVWSTGDRRPAWDELDEPSAAPSPPPTRRTASFAPAALPVAVILVLGLFVFLKGRPWWNPQVRESPTVPLTPMRDKPPQQTMLEELPQLAPTGQATNPVQPAPRSAQPARRERGTLKELKDKVGPRRHLRGSVAPDWRRSVRSGDLIARGPDVSVPVPLDLPSFSYPAAARGRAGDVDVHLELLVDENGRVIDARVREGDTSGLGFNEIALAAARRVPFQPGMRGQVPDTMWTEMIFAFSDPGAPSPPGR